MKLNHLIKDRQPIQRGGIWFASHTPVAPGYDSARERMGGSPEKDLVRTGIRLRRPVEQLTVAVAYTVTIVSFGLAAIVAGELLS